MGIFEKRNDATKGDAPNGHSVGIPVFTTGKWSAAGCRPNNEDFCVVNSHVGFIAVADGIGGAHFGEVVSRVGCNVAHESFVQDGNLGRAFAHANTAAYVVLDWLGEKNSGSGSTLLLASLHDQTLDLAYAGDTAAFLLREGQLRRITGLGRRNENLESPAFNTLDAAIGLSNKISPNTSSIDIAAGDRFLFCTDGVWDALGEEELARLMSTDGTAPALCSRIVDASTNAGTDNATAVLVIIAGDDTIL